MAQQLSGKDGDRAPASAPLWRAYVVVAASGLSAAAKAIARFVRTVWRLAEALDSALWRGFKLSLRATGGFIASSLRTARDALADVFRWLPSRGGRAYAAASSVVLAISALWIVDEIRNAGAEDRALDSIFRPPVDLDDPVVARVDGRFVHLSEIEASARAADQIRDDEKLTLDAAFDRKLVEAHVEQRLLARAAANEGLHRDPAVLRRLNAARDRILASSFMESRIEAAVTPERVKRLYESQVDVTRLGDEVKARHILVATEAEALSIIAEIRAGGDFAAYARARSLDRATAPLGGEIGWFTKDMMTPDFAAVAFATQRGAISEPFPSEFGWHILEVEDRRPARGVSLGAVEDNVKRFLTMRTVSQTIDELKQEENVLYFPPEGSLRE
jgi:peptidyl-prolyl cis-trans isomerase C